MINSFTIEVRYALKTVTMGARTLTDALRVARTEAERSRVNSAVVLNRSRVLLGRFGGEV